MRPVPGVKNKNRKSKVGNGFGLKEVRPMAPRNNRMGRSPPISFLLRPAPGVSKKIKIEKSKNQKVKVGLVLRKYGLRPQGTILRAKVRQLAYADEVNKSKWVWF